MVEKIQDDKGPKKNNKMKWPFEADYGVSTSLTREQEAEVDAALDKENWMRWVNY